jgi:predicted ATPase
MLTRIEIDGFKTFENARLDVSPFLVLLGPNASGKSNLFDAIRFLSQLALTDLRTACRDLRGEPHELFRRSVGGEPGNKMSFAVEVLLEPRVRDPWGQEVELVHTRLRYEVGIERHRDSRGIERLVVAREEARALIRSEDRWLSGVEPEGVVPRVSEAFREQFMSYAKHRRNPFLETKEKEGKPSFEIHQDIRAGRVRPAEAAEATVLSSMGSAEFPHLYALREELRSWRFLHLDPAALRRPSPTIAPEILERDGSNLATVLARIQAETRTEERPSGALTDIAADLGELISGVSGISVEEDDRNREYRVSVALRDGFPFSSRVISDGTLRVLALLTMLHDPKHGGLVCFEEPENGVHPMRLRRLIERLRQLVTDPESAERTAEPLTQILMNSHSPVVLAALKAGRELPIDVVFADVIASADPGTGKLTRRTRLRPIPADLLVTVDDQHVAAAEVARYLETVDSSA